MTTNSRTFRIFVSSTFSDLKAERNALQESIDGRCGASGEAVLGRQILIQDRDGGFSHAHNLRQLQPHGSQVVRSELPLPADPLAGELAAPRWGNAVVRPERPDRAAARRSVRAAILDAIDAAQFALLLVSEAFFASDFIRDVELPRILQRAEEDGLVVIPILLEPCDWQSFEYVASRQMLPGRPTPLINYTSSDREWVYARDQVLSGIRRRLRRASPPPPSPAKEPLSPHVESPPLHTEALPIFQASFSHLVQGEGIMVGRQRELETLATVWERARTGSAQAVVISGEAGIGKTRCIAGFLCGSVGSESYILLSSATAHPPSAPYEALTEMLSPAVAQDAIPEIDEEFLAEVARTVPGLAARCPHLPKLDELPPDRARARLHWALTAYLLGLCVRAPVILFVDDLQWTDEPSLDFLLDFLIHQASAPLLVVASFRTEDQPNPAFIRRWRTELRGKSRLTEVNLFPWSEAETHRFITAWLGIPEAPLFSRRLQRVAEGNPMYLTEILRSLRQQGLLYRDETGAVSTPFDNTTQDYEELPIPESISDLIRLRMDNLSADACAFLKAVAVIGNQFDPEIAQEVGELTTDQRDEALDELTTAQLVDAAGSRLWLQTQPAPRGGLLGPQARRTPKAPCQGRERYSWMLSAPRPRRPRFRHSPTTSIAARLGTRHSPTNWRPAWARSSSTMRARHGATCNRPAG